jgi:Holliday junction resolvase RusA-like endonuclease
MRTVSFQVFGTARPKGSHNGMIRPGTRDVYLQPASRGLKAWEFAVRAQAQRAIAPDPRLFTGAVRVQITFVFGRPPSVSVKKRPAMIVAPDCDKLCRGVLDGLCGVFYRDDAVVTHLHARKVYGAINEPDRADITVSEVAADAVQLVPRPLLEAV